MEIGISKSMSLIAEVKVGQMAVVKTGTFFSCKITKMTILPRSASINFQHVNNEMNFFSHGVEEKMFLMTEFPLEI